MWEYLSGIEMENVSEMWDKCTKHVRETERWEAAKKHKSVGARDGNG